jgi:hypothetical protein
MFTALQSQPSTECWETQIGKPDEQGPDPRGHVVQASLRKKSGGVLIQFSNGGGGGGVGGRGRSGLLA